jgi:F0F1-type ATP synthase delta subunit
MNNDITNFNQILDKTRLKQQADELNEGLDDIVTSMFKIKGISFLERINNRFPKETAAILINVLERNRIDDTDLSAIKVFFTNLQNILAKAKIAYLTLSIEPESDLITAISDFFRTSFADQSILLDIKVDHKIIAGAELIWKGKYYNLSLEKKLEEVFTKSYANL